MQGCTDDKDNTGFPMGFESDLYPAHARAQLKDD